MAIKCQNPNTLERYLRLALKAQSQCRTNWEAIASIKNPPIHSYVNQANINQGNQQINNYPPRSKSNIKDSKFKNKKNKLMENKDDEWLDTKTQKKTSQINTEMETLDKINRPKIKTR